MGIDSKYMRSLMEELQDLVYEERPKLMRELKEARKLGDLSENETYHALRERQAAMEDRIAELEEALQLLSAKPVSDVLQ